MFRRAGHILGVLLPICLLLTAWGCGGGDFGQVETPKDKALSFEPDTSRSISLERLEEWRDKRAAAGDTFAVAPGVLDAALTKSIPGYELEIDEAETFETQSFTFSEATKVFYDAKGDYVELIAGDYVANPEFFEVALQRFNLAQDVELDGLRDKKLPYECSGGQFCFAWESYSSPRRLAQANFVIGFRFFVSVSSTGREGFIPMEELMGWMDLSALKNL